VFGITAGDPATSVAAAGVLLLIAAAVAVPAIRAARVRHFRRGQFGPKFSA
jgi:hypothetical protein